MQNNSYVVYCSTSDAVIIQCEEMLITLLLLLFKLDDDVALTIKIFVIEVSIKVITFLHYQEMDEISIYLDRLVVGSFITITSVISPNLLK